MTFYTPNSLRFVTLSNACVRKRHKAADRAALPPPLNLSAGEVAAVLCCEGASADGTLRGRPCCSSRIVAAAWQLELPYSMKIRNLIDPIHRIDPMIQVQSIVRLALAAGVG
jgi:hypothetical protein